MYQRVKMRISLKSDFHDYYDYHFDSVIPDKPSVTMERMQVGGLKRSEMFPFMERLGLRVPKYGIAREIGEEKIIWCIVHTDEMAHTGEGKFRYLSSRIPEEHLDLFAVQYVYRKDIDKKYWFSGQSFRWLRVGECNFFLRYFSGEDWRSNVGENVKIDIVGNPGIDLKLISKVNRPLYAVDFVMDRYGALFAIDYNSAPGVKGTPIEEMIPAGDFVGIIRRWYEKMR
jgi:hypothetical protein